MVGTLEQLFIASGSSTLSKALECLIEIAKTSDGRLDLSYKNVLLPLLELCKSPLELPGEDLILSVKLIRNLCAGELTNQNLFIEQNGAGILLSMISSTGLTSGCNSGLLRMLLQTLGNVSLAGEKHQISVWHQFFPLAFLDVARVRNKETCGSLCMVIYTCCESSDGRCTELIADSGLDIIVEIMRTITEAGGYREDWVKWLLSMVCLEKFKFWIVFSKLFPVVEPENAHDDVWETNQFVAEQAFLLSILSEILNEQIEEMTVSAEFSLCIFGLLKNVVSEVDFTSRGKLPLRTGLINVDVMGYALSILRDICASPKISNPGEEGDPVDKLVSAGLLKFLLTLLHDLEPPAMIRKAMNYNDTNNGKISNSSMYCPYRGFRRDVVAVIGNCSYGRKHVQDELREQNGILLMLQHCVTDEDNPFLREWGIWSMRNILEGNLENQKIVADLEVQGSVDTPEISELGLRVDVDPKTGRPKLVNTS